MSYFFTSMMDSASALSRVKAHSRSGLRISSAASTSPYIYKTKIMKSLRSRLDPTFSLGPRLDCESILDRIENKLDKMQTHVLEYIIKDPLENFSAEACAMFIYKNNIDRIAKLAMPYYIAPVELD